jgi:hypothetical protein
LAGTYRDAGYGVLELCLVNLSPEDRIASASASKSTSCRQLIDEIPTALPGILDPHVPTWGEADAGARHNSYFTFCLLILMFFVANLYIQYLPSSYPQYPSRFSVLRIVYVLYGFQ